MSRDGIQTENNETVNGTEVRIWAGNKCFGSEYTTETVLKVAFLFYSTLLNRPFPNNFFVLRFFFGLYPMSSVFLYCLISLILTTRSLNMSPKRVALLLRCCVEHTQVEPLILWTEKGRLLTEIFNPFGSPVSRFLILFGGV